jgi:lipid II:glycine glycyltransferase (peptidoglycan interpeptide bridge formation enzyme)
MDENRPLGLVQAVYQKRFGFGHRLEVGGTYGDGPVLADVENKGDVLRELIAALEKYGIKNRVPECFIYWLAKSKMDNVFSEMGYDHLSSFNVYRVDLRKTVEELLKDFSHNKRRNIKKAQGQGVEVVQGTEYNDLVSFYELLDLSSKRAKFLPPPFERLHAYLRVFGANHKARVFLANLGGRHVAGVFVVTCGDVAYALGAGSREEVWNVRPNDLLHSKAMEWACNAGLSYYHMGRVSEPPPVEGSADWGLWRWKREWNGQLEKVLVYYKIYLPKLKKFMTDPYAKILDTMRRIR